MDKLCYESEIMHNVTLLTHAFQIKTKVEVMLDIFSFTSIIKNSKEVLSLLSDQAGVRVWHFMWHMLISIERT